MVVPYGSPDCSPPWYGISPGPFPEPAGDSSGVKWMRIAQTGACLTVRHQGVQVFPQRFHVEALDRLAIVEAPAHRPNLAIVLMQDVEIEGMGPPFCDRRVSRRDCPLHHRASTRDVLCCFARQASALVCELEARKTGDLVTLLKSNIIMFSIVISYCFLGPAVPRAKRTRPPNTPVTQPWPSVALAH